MAIYSREIDPLPIEVLRAEVPSELRAAFEKHGEIAFRAAFEHSQFLPQAQPFVRRLLLEAEGQRTEATLKAMAAASDAAERSARYTFWIAIATFAVAVIAAAGVVIPLFCK